MTATNNSTAPIDLANRPVYTWQVILRATTAILSNALILGAFLIAPIVFIVYSITAGLMWLIG